MRVEQFEATNLTEALSQVRLELGERAVILQTRRTRRGMLGRLGLREQVQVLAALDETNKPATPPTLDPVSMAVSRSGGRSNLTGACPGDRDERPSPMPDRFTGTPGLSGERSGKSSVRSPGVIGFRERLIERLSASGMERAFAEDIIAFCGADLSPASVVTEVERRLRIPKVSPMKGRRRIALVGPTGVGKTTTTAKLAARYALTEKKRVAMITMDTYRIGAVEQLRIYARVMGLPLEVVHSPEEMRDAVALHADKDVILIDTVGRSPRKALQLAEMGSLLNAADPTETHLVLSAPSTLDYLLDAADQFASLRTNRLIVTKLDEMPRWGTLVSLVNGTGLPLSFITDGQEVPRNLRPADPGEIASQILGGAR